MSKDDSLRFKVTISKQAYPELHQYIAEAGAYYGSKRMLQLALLGMSVTKGHQVITTQQVTSPYQPVSRTTAIVESSTTEHSGYKIPASAAAAISKMFDTLENFGLKQSD